MEYSVMTTNRCNLNCAYCINAERRRKEPARKADARKVVEHIRKDSAEHGYDPVVVTFYGGEPMMESGLLEEVMAGTADLKPMYNMFTNGTLLGEDKLWLMDKMQLISVSLDGDERLHDEVRGKGSYKRVLGNYLALKGRLKASVMAFVTLTPRSSVYDSVMGAAKYFDSVFWFLENSASEEGLEAFKKDYGRGLDRLLDVWIENLAAGKVLKFLPFQGLYDIMEHKHVYTGLPCGIGSNFQAIAIDGSVYSCEDSYHNRLGDISGGVDMRRSRTDYKFSVCDGCEVKGICAGRCVIPHLNYGAGKVEFYCECTKLIVNKFKAALPEIRRIVASGAAPESDILNKFTRFTDVIP